MNDANVKFPNFVSKIHEGTETNETLEHFLAGRKQITDNRLYDDVNR